MEQLLSILRNIAVIPSFSSYEEHLHPAVKALLEPVTDAEWHTVPENNLIVSVPGNPNRRPVALSSHLDKINHFGSNPPPLLPYRQESNRVTGQLDDAVGLAICIALARVSHRFHFPPLILLFSEMEESFGLKHHPHLLKNGGSGYWHGMGAERISHFLLKNKMIPSAVITVDTTPLFQGKNGLALYSAHWQFTGQMPGEKENKQTERIRKEFLTLDPEIILSNNTNDYLHYGVEMNRDKRLGIPSLAIEPAIFPYHQKNESVFLVDIERVFEILIRWLEQTE